MLETRAVVRSFVVRVVLAIAEKIDEAASDTPFTIGSGPFVAR